MMLHTNDAATTDRPGASSASINVDPTADGPGGSPASTRDTTASQSGMSSSGKIDDPPASRRSGASAADVAGGGGQTAPNAWCSQRVVWPRFAAVVGQNVVGPQPFMIPAATAALMSASLAFVSSSVKSSSSVGGSPSARTKKVASDPRLTRPVGQK